MIHSAKQRAVTPRWLRGAVLLGVLALLPLGVGIAQAGEPDYEAVAQRLEEAVRAGELTTFQAAAMMGKLAEAGFVQRMEEAVPRQVSARHELLAVGRKIRAAVQAGKLTPDEGRQKMEAYRQSLGAGHSKPRAVEPTAEERAAVEARIRARAEEARAARERARAMSEKAAALRAKFMQMSAEIRAAVAAGEITAGEGQAKLRSFQEKVRSFQESVWSGAAKPPADESSREETDEMRAEIGAAVAGGELSVEDAEKRWAAYLRRVRKAARRAEGEGPSRLEGYFERMGVDGSALARVRKHLGDQGLSEEQVEKALGGLLRVVHEVNTEGAAFELDPDVRAYFVDQVGLDGAQLEMVVGVARRISARTQRAEK